MSDINQLIEQLSKLTVLEAADLVKQLETKWGVSAAASVAVAAGAGGAAPAGAAAPAAEVQTTFDVILASVTADKKIGVIKAVREVKPGLGLAEAKALVEGAPKPVLEGANKADADNRNFIERRAFKRRARWFCFFAGFGFWHCLNPYMHPAL